MERKLFFASILFIVLLGVVGFVSENKKNSSHSTHGEAETNVTNFTISDIKLGETYDKVDAIAKKQGIKKLFIDPKELYNLPREISSKYTIKKFLEKKDTGFSVEYGREKYGYERYTLYFDNNLRVYAIIRKKQLLVKPNLEQIKKQLIEKYGKPDMDTSSGIYYCWGACKLIEYKEEGTVAITGKKNEKSLIIHYREKSENYGHQMFFYLNDDEMGKKYHKWRWNLVFDHEQKLKKDASILDL